MLDIKEITYFVACVQTGSFSRAAETLYTTQSSVSKTIKAMEDETGALLFERLAKGIRMTPEGEQMYPYALRILENLEKMQPTGNRGTAPVLSVSCNPSSWFADVFVRFFRRHQGERIHYQVYSADSREIARRVRERTDDLGFVYVMKNQLPAFRYFLSRNYLEFCELKETDVMLYPGAGCGEGWERDGRAGFSGMKLIQRFPDEFSSDNYWNIADENGYTAAEAETVITTNSDYIMERVLKFADLVNISSGYLAGTPQKESAQGIPLRGRDARILFGYIKRRGEELSGTAADFLDYVEESLDC